MYENAIENVLKTFWHALWSILEQHNIMHVRKPKFKYYLTYLMHMEIIINVFYKFHILLNYLQKFQFMSIPYLH